MANRAYIKNDGIIVVIKTPAKIKKICKLFFTSRDTSLYIHFYSGEGDYYYGKEKLLAGNNNLSIKFKQGKKINNPPKLSYHESGKVHFQLNNNKETTEETTATPLKEMRGEHIITLHVLSLSDFEDFDNKKNINYLTIDFKEEIENHKLIFYGSIKDMINKYKFGFTLKRNNFLINFGVRLINPKEKFENNKGFYALSGWDIEAGNIKNSADLLYLTKL